MSEEEKEEEEGGVSERWPLMIRIHSGRDLMMVNNFLWIFFHRYDVRFFVDISLVSLYYDYYHYYYERSRGGMERSSHMTILLPAHLLTQTLLHVSIMVSVRRPRGYSKSHNKNLAYLWLFRSKIENEYPILSYPNYMMSCTLYDTYFYKYK